MIDLVCWDFGDTLVDERFMRYPPEGVPEWSSAYEEVLAERPDWVDGWNLGRGSINDLIEPLAARLPAMSRAQISHYLRAVWGRIEWFDDSRRLMNELAGKTLQAIVTVNPHEFSGIAEACALTPRVDAIVTSAELGTLSKVTMAVRVRELLALPPGLTTTVLIDNRTDNVDEFAAADGQTIHYQPGQDSLASFGTGGGAAR